MDVIPIMRPWLGAEEAAAVAERARLGLGRPGPAGRRVRGAGVRARSGAAHGVAMTSCTTALHLALHALGVGPGDEVVVPSLSFIATANAARYVGARPVFADVDLETQNLTAETVERALGPATRAVIVVHQGGMPADVDAIEAVCAAARRGGGRGRGVRHRLDLPRPAGRRAGGSWRSRFHPRKVDHHRRGRHAADGGRRRWPGGCGGCASTA